jgi:hypothetical protein
MYQGNQFFDPCPKCNATDGLAEMNATDITPWPCEACEGSGVILNQAGKDIIQVMNFVERFPKLRG